MSGLSKRLWAFLIIFTSVIVLEAVGNVTGIDALQTDIDEFEPMSADEQMTVICGDGTQGLCKSVLGDECNQPDTFCDQGDQYCAEQHTLLIPCSDSWIYERVSRCTAETQTTKCCSEEGTEPIPCYKIYDCVCKQDQNTQDWYCDLPSGEETPPTTSHPVNSCKLVSCGTPE